MTKKLYVGNLSFQTTEADVEGLFAQVGPVESVSIITDRDTGRSKGFGFVVMEDADADTLWQVWRQVDEPLVAQVHNADMLVYAWTVDDPHHMQRLIDVGVDGLCTNHPERGRQAVDSLIL